MYREQVVDLGVLLGRSDGKGKRTWNKSGMYHVVYPPLAVSYYRFGQ